MSHNCYSLHNFVDHKIVDRLALIEFWSHMEPNDRSIGIYLSIFLISERSPLERASKFASIFSISQSHHFKSRR